MRKLPFEKSCQYQMVVDALSEIRKNLRIISAIDRKNALELDPMLLEEVELAALRAGTVQFLFNFEKRYMKSKAKTAVKV